jgi:hypothetical protein
VKVINVGVAAHITGACPGGPRFDPAMSEANRRGTANGIWLCQTCAKLIDSDVIAYPATKLCVWKANAEEEARIKIGKTNVRTSARSHKQAIADLKRDQKLRDHLHRDLLKSPAERMALPRFSSRSSQFAHSEVIIRRIDDRTYPNMDDSPGISGWFKLEVLDFYHGGLEGIVDMQPALLDTMTRKWALITYEQSKSPFPARFSNGTVFVTGKIPWRNILHYDMRGDEFYPQPHLYCTYVDPDGPWEGRGYFLVRDGRQPELRREDLTELATLLEIAVAP